jgi:hypothetical protein
MLISHHFFSLSSVCLVKYLDLYLFVLLSSLFNSFRKAKLSDIQLDVPTFHPLKARRFAGEHRHVAAAVQWKRVLFYIAIAHGL